MSYEGRVQLICKNGHFWMLDGYEYDSQTSDYDNDGPYQARKAKCPYCKENEAFSRGIDDTNGDACGEIDISKLLIKEGKLETCNLGHVHKIEQDTYRIPNEDELKELEDEKCKECGNCELI